jgi:hypothetical protein
LLSLAYLVIRWIFGVVVWALRPSRNQALEIVVLRHQLEVVQRQVARAQFQPRDRVLWRRRAGFYPGRGGPHSPSGPRHCSGGTFISSHGVRRDGGARAGVGLPFPPR